MNHFTPIDRFRGATLLAFLLFAPLAQAQNPAVVTEVGRPAASTTITCTDGVAGSDSTERNIFCNLAEQVINEAAARAMTDTELQDNINTESAARGRGDTEIRDELAIERGRISVEITDRTAADTGLQTNITAEATARTAADATEATAREAADDTLQANIDTEETAREAADDTLQANIDTEETAREVADDMLQVNIDNEEAARMVADGLLDNRISANVVAIDKNVVAIDENVAAIKDLNQKVDKLEAELSAGIAMSLALQAPAVSPGKRLNLSIGAGTYNGEEAVAVSVGVRVDDRWSINGGVGYGASRSDFGARIGATVEF